MMYEEKLKRGECANIPLPEQERNLSDVLRETGKIAFDVKREVSKIREHLFGAVPMHCTGEAKPATQPCFREELAETRHDLLMALEALSEIRARLGVQ